MTMPNTSPPAPAPMVGLPSRWRSRYVASGTSRVPVQTTERSGWRLEVRQDAAGLGRRTPHGFAAVHLSTGAEYRHAHGFPALPLAMRAAESWADLRPGGAV